MSDIGVEREQPIIDGNEARVLRIGMVEPGIERVPGVAELNSLLQPLQDDASSVELPIELEDTARSVAQLVIASELSHMQNMLGAERFRDLDGRLFSEHGLFAKVVALRKVLGTEDSDPIGL